MDLPNITLFFQIGNFCVAYFILRKFIFEPALKIIIEEQSHLDSLHKKVENAQIDQQENIEQQKSHWYKIKSTLSLQVPDFSDKLCSAKILDDKIDLKQLNITNDQKKAVYDMLQSELSDIKI